MMEDDYGEVDDFDEQLDEDEEPAFDINDLD